MGYFEWGDRGRFNGGIDVYWRKENSVLDYVLGDKEIGEEIERLEIGDHHPVVA